MAKQVGPLFFTGTVDGVIFYKLGEHYYLRNKGDYKSGKQMRKDPRLKRTMQKAEQFGAASKLVKPIYYRYLPKTVRKHGLFGKLTGMVNGWLQKGKSKEVVKELLIAYCMTLQTTTAAIVLKTQKLTTPKAAPTVTTPIMEKQAVTTPARNRVKQARYLSTWKVKTNGRLHAPKHRRATGLPAGVPLACQAALLAASDDGIKSITTLQKDSTILQLLC